jgi:hypothetical protein
MSGTIRRDPTTDKNENEFEGHDKIVEIIISSSLSSCSFYYY